MIVHRNSLIKVQVMLNSLLATEQKEFELHKDQFENGLLVVLLQLETLSKVKQILEQVKVSGNLNKITKTINKNADNLSAAVVKATP